MQFGYDDAAPGGAKQRLAIYDDWRNRWIKDGMRWDKGSSDPPIGWNAANQLRQLERMNSKDVRKDGN
jgi:hypothetical protein